MSGLQPLSSDDTRLVANNLWMAICLLPKHRHNKDRAAEDCPTCSAKDYMIKAFKTFKRVGDK